MIVQFYNQVYTRVWVEHGFRSKRIHFYLIIDHTIGDEPPHKKPHLEDSKDSVLERFVLNLRNNDSLSPMRCQSFRQCQNHKKLRKVYTSFLSALPHS